MKSTHLAIAIATGLISSTPTIAYETGDFLVRARILNIVPDEDSDDLRIGGVVTPETELQVSDNLSLGIDFTYMLTPRWGIELLLDISSKHTIRSKGAVISTLVSKVADTRVLPPTLLL